MATPKPARRKLCGGPDQRERTEDPYREDKQVFINGYAAGIGKSTEK